MAINILPTRRNLRFKLNPSKALTWHQDGRNVSQFLNTLSLFFPVGERFFIDSVRHYRDVVQDPELKKAVTAFYRPGSHARPRARRVQRLRQ